MNTLERLLRGDPALYGGEDIVSVQQFPKTEHDIETVNIITIDSRKVYHSEWTNGEDLIAQPVIMINDEVEGDVIDLVDIRFRNMEDTDTVNHNKTKNTLNPLRGSSQITQNNQISKKLLLA